MDHKSESNKRGSAVNILHIIVILVTGYYTIDAITGVYRHRRQPSAVNTSEKYLNEKSEVRRLHTRRVILHELKTAVH